MKFKYDLVVRHQQVHLFLEQVHSEVKVKEHACMVSGSNCK